MSLSTYIIFSTEQIEKRRNEVNEELNELVKRFEASAENLSTQDSYDNYLNGRSRSDNRRNRGQQKDRENGNDKLNNNGEGADEDDDDDSDSSDLQEDFSMQSHGKYRIITFFIKEGFRINQCFICSGHQN